MLNQAPRISSNSKVTLSILFVMLLILSSNLIAQDNPKPSSWKNIDVKIHETYGNNQSRTMRGAKVTIDVDESAASPATDANAERNLAGRMPRLPQTKTSGSRGTRFSRMPPSSLVGAYRVTVTPKNKNCQVQSKTFIHNSQRASSPQFHFTCFGPSRSPAANQNLASNDPQSCHNVRINSQGRQARLHKPVTVEACPREDGLWVIKPFKY